MFRLLDRIGPPPTLRPENEDRRKDPMVSKSKPKPPLDSLDAAFPSPELEFFVISFEYPDVVKSPASVVVGSSP